MNGLEWALNIAFAAVVGALVLAKWSVFRMAQEINRTAGPGEQISLQWWPNYKDRRVARLYRSAVPQGHWRTVYIASLSSALIVFFVAVFLASHLQPQV